MIEISNQPLTLKFFPNFHLKLFMSKCFLFKAELICGFQEAFYLNFNFLRSLLFRAKPLVSFIFFWDCGSTCSTSTCHQGVDTFKSWSLLLLYQVLDINSITLYNKTKVVQSKGWLSTRGMDTLHRHYKIKSMFQGAWRCL